MEDFITVFNMLSSLAKFFLKNKYFQTEACKQEFLVGNNTPVRTLFFFLLSAVMEEFRDCPQGHSVFLFQLPLKIYICK